MKIIKKLFPVSSDYPESRLFSLDILRGLDMLLLLVVGPLISVANRSWQCFSPEFMGQFVHNWSGFTLWDIIMPLFIFMCGAAMPFALGRRLKDGNRAFWGHVLWRVVMLWFLGMLVQGNLAQLNPLTFGIFTNTLESIAVGYLITALVMRIPSRAIRIAMPAILAGVYTVFLAVGDYGEFTNNAFRFEQKVLGLILPDGNAFRVFKDHMPNHYTWFSTSLMFGAMTLCGFHATELLRSSLAKKQKAAWMFAYAAGLLALGFATSSFIPVIKPIFTLSFTALAMGWSVLALAVLYVVCDVLMLRKGTALILLFGQFALTAYFSAHFFRESIRVAARTMVQGLEQFCEKGTYAFVVQIAYTIALIALLVVWRKAKGARK